MLCKISGQGDAATPISWPSSLTNREQQLERNPSRDQAAASEIAQLRAQIGEIESSCQAKISQARQSAFDAGVQKGREENAALAKDASDRLAHTLSELASLKRKIRNEAEGELLKLALAIAKRILYRELATDPEAIQGIIHSALQNLQNREISQVRVYPNGADAVRNSLERAGAPAAVRVIPDSSLRDGDVVFETSLGDLDVSIETQLQEIQRGFADRLRSR